MGRISDLKMHRGWATIEGDWNRFYKEYAGLYDRFAVDTAAIVEEMQALADFTGERVLSLAAGTGRDVFEIAPRASRVVGLEPWIEMRSFAVAKAARLGIANVEFVDGVAEDLSRFPDASFDRVISVHGAPFPWDDDAFIRGCLRVVRPGGTVMFGGTSRSSAARHPGATPPGPIATPAPDPSSLTGRSRFETRVTPFTYTYASREEALATWGFIRGPVAIDYLLDNDPAPLFVNLVVHHRQA